jgi:hypothetical protein
MTSIEQSKKQYTVWESDYPKRYLQRTTHLTHQYSIILVHEVPEFLRQFCDLAEVVIFISWFSQVSLLTKYERFSF